MQTTSTSTLAVRVHCPSDVRGAAKQFPYYTASLFRQHTTRDGRVVWKNARVGTRNRRSFRLAKQDAAQLAAEHGAMLIDGYGSLHHRPVS